MQPKTIVKLLILTTRKLSLFYYLGIDTISSRWAPWKMHECFGKVEKSVYSP